jgi:molybdopterin-guanine dinucleotide biosynthesis protein A
MTSSTFDVVVLAGGRSTRMRGADKTQLVVGGLTMLDRVLAATAAARTVVVVGAERPTRASVAWTRESPPGGGPAAAVAAGLPLVTAKVVVLLAADLPLVTSQLIDDLVCSLASDGVVVADDDGRPQWLCSAWRTDALRSAGLVAGAALRETLGRLPFTTIAAAGAAWLDCDTPEDLRRARELA